MSGPNWAKLYSQGRCKAIGVSFSEEEQLAIHKLGIPVDYVRAGVITLKDYKKQLQNEGKDGEAPMFKMDRKELFEMARELGIQAVPDVSKEVLIAEIEKVKGIRLAKSDQAGAVEKAVKNQEKEEVKERAKVDLKVKREREAQEKKFKNDEEKAKADTDGQRNQALETQKASEKKAKEGEDKPARAIEKEENVDNDPGTSKEDKEKEKAKEDLPKTPAQKVKDEVKKDKKDKEVKNKKK